MTKVVCRACGADAYKLVDGKWYYMDGREVKPKDILICEFCKHHIITKEEDHGKPTE